MPKIKHNFIQGKMNKDLDERLVPGGQYRDALNIQVSSSEDSEIGTIQNILGNSKVPGQGFIADNAICVGSISDEKNDKLYWFVLDQPENLLGNSEFNDQDSISGTILEYGKWMIVSDSGVHGMDITGGVLVRDNTNTGNNSSARQAVDIEEGVTYNISYDRKRTGGTTGRTNVFSDFGNGNTIYASETENSGNFITVTDSVTATVTGKMSFRMYFIDDMEGEIDNVSLTRLATSRIIQYDTKKNIITPVLVDIENTILQLNKDILITGINIIDDMLFWTDGQGEPKKINISRSIEGTDSRGFTHTRLINPTQGIDYSTNITDITEEHITVIKKPPFSSPILNMEDVSTRDAALTWAGIMQVSSGPSFATSIINSTQGNITNFSSLGIGDSFKTFIISDTTGSVEFSLNWNEGDEVVLAAFNSSGQPSTPLTHYSIKGTITDWEFNEFTNLTTDFIGPTTLNGNFSGGIGQDPNDWWIPGSFDKWVWDSTHKNMEAVAYQNGQTGGWLISNNGNSFPIDVVEGQVFRLEFDIGPPNDGTTPLQGRLFGSIHVNADGTTGEYQKIFGYDIAQATTAGHHVYTFLIDSTNTDPLTGYDTSSSFGSRDNELRFGIADVNSMGDYFNGTIDNVSLKLVNELDPVEMVSWTGETTTIEKQAQVEIKVNAIIGDIPDIPVGQDTHKYVIDLFDSQESLFKHKFPRFAYRYRYLDGEYSVMSPFTEVAFKPSLFTYEPIDAYNIGMQNNIKSVTLSGFDLTIPKDVKSIDILYKEETSPNIYIVDTISASTPISDYTIKQETVQNGVVPSNQLIRPWDNVPKKALAQEVSGNRIIYGNYTQNYDLIDSVSGNNFYQDLQTNLISSSITGFQGTKSIKSLRDYQVGVIWADEYGRQTPILTSDSASTFLTKNQSGFSNSFKVKMNNDGHPVNMKYFKFFIKDNSGEYYNMVMDRFYDAGQGAVWLSFPSSDRNKIEIDDFIILKKGVASSDAVTDDNRYKVLDIKNEAPDSLSWQDSLVLTKLHDTSLSPSLNLFDNSDDLPDHNRITFQIDFGQIEYNAFANIEDAWLNRDAFSDWFVELTNSDIQRNTGKHRIVGVRNDGVGNVHFTMETPFSDQSPDHINEFTPTTSVIDNTILNIWKREKSFSNVYKGRFFVKIKGDSIFTITQSPSITSTTQEVISVASRKLYGLTCQTDNKIWFPSRDMNLPNVYIGGGVLDGDPSSNNGFFAGVGSNAMGADTDLRNDVAVGPNAASKSWMGWWAATARTGMHYGTLNRRKRKSNVPQLTPNTPTPTQYLPVFDVDENRYESIFLDYDAYFRGINVSVHPSTLTGNRKNSDEFDIHNTHFNGHGYEDVWFIDGGIAPGICPSTGGSGQPQPWDPTTITLDGETLQPAGVSSNTIEIGFGGIQPITWPSDYTESNFEIPGFFDLQGANSNYSTREKDFIDKITIGSQFRFKEDPTQTVYTIQNVDIYNRVRYETLQRASLSGSVGEGIDYEYGNLTRTQMMKYQLLGLTPGAFANVEQYTSTSDPASKSLISGTWYNAIGHPLGDSNKGVQGEWTSWGLPNAGWYGSTSTGTGHKGIGALSAHPDHHRVLETIMPGPEPPTSNNAHSTLSQNGNPVVYKTSTFLRPSNFTKNFHLTLDQPLVWDPYTYQSGSYIQGARKIELICSEAAPNTAPYNRFRVSSLTDATTGEVLTVGMVLYKFDNGGGGTFANLTEPAVVEKIGAATGNGYLLHFKTYDGSKSLQIGSTDDIAVNDVVGFAQFPMNGLSRNAAKNLNWWRDSKGFNATTAGTTAIGYTIEFLESAVDYFVTDDSLPPNPAIWETEPKDKTSDLDIFYEASDFYPVKLENSMIAGPITMDNGSAIPSGVTITSFEDGTGWITLSQHVNVRNMTPSNVTLTNFGSVNNPVYEDTKYINFGDKLKIDLNSGTTVTVRIIDGTNNNQLDSNGNTDRFRVDVNLYKASFTLDWFNCFAFGNGVESNRILDVFNRQFLLPGVKVSTIFEDYQEENRKYGLIYSGIYNSNSGINNLNQFIQGEKITKDINPDYGSIQKLHSRDTDLVTLCEDKVVRILANKDAVFNADGNIQLTATQNVLGQTIPFVGEYGISKNPESFISEAYRSYFTDKQRGTVMRLSKDGLTPISDHGMSDWFKDNLSSSVTNLMESFLPDNVINVSGVDEAGNYIVQSQDIDVERAFEQNAPITFGSTNKYAWEKWGTGGNTGDYTNIPHFGSFPYIHKDNILEIGKKYRIQFDVVEVGGRTTDPAPFYIHDIGGNPPELWINNNHPSAWVGVRIPKSNFTGRVSLEWVAETKNFYMGLTQVNGVAGEYDGYPATATKTIQEYVGDLRNETAGSYTYHTGAYFYGATTTIQNIVLEEVKEETKLIGSYDDKKSEYNITIHSEDPKTVSFKENVTGWVSFKSFLPENALSCANDYYTFKDGKIWQHHIEGSSRNTFYGVKYPSKFTTVLNDLPHIVKSFHTIDYEGSQARITGIKKVDVDRVVYTGSAFQPDGKFFYFSEDNWVGKTQISPQAEWDTLINMMVDPIVEDFTGYGTSPSYIVTSTRDNDVKQYRNGLLIKTGRIKVWHGYHTGFGTAIHGRWDDGTEGAGDWEVGDIITTEEQEKSVDVFNSSSTNGWYVSNIKTDLQEGSIPEFVKKEGRWFNYIKGKELTSHIQGRHGSKLNLYTDFSTFNIQGIGTASFVDDTGASPYGISFNNSINSSLQIGDILYSEFISESTIGESLVSDFDDVENIELGWDLTEAYNNGLKLGGNETHLSGGTITSPPLLLEDDGLRILGDSSHVGVYIPFMPSEYFELKHKHRYRLEVDVTDLDNPDSIHIKIYIDGMVSGVGDRPILTDAITGHTAMHYDITEARKYLLDFTWDIGINENQKEGRIHIELKNSNNVTKEVTIKSISLKELSGGSSFLGFDRVESENIVKVGKVTKINRSQGKKITLHSIEHSTNSTSGAPGKHARFMQSQMTAMLNAAGPGIWNDTVISVVHERNNVILDIVDVRLFNDDFSIDDPAHLRLENNAIGGDWEVGDIISIPGDTKNTVYVDDEGIYPRPIQNTYIMFAKDAIINTSSLLGYYADVTFTNYSSQKIELFSVNSDITQSSKD